MTSRYGFVCLLFKPLINLQEVLWALIKTSLLAYICCCCSVSQSCLILCDLMDCSTLGFPVLHCLLEFAQTHVHWVTDAIQPSYPLCPLLLLPSIFPSISIFSNESGLCNSWPKCWKFSFSNSPSSEYSGLISFRKSLVRAWTWLKTKIWSNKKQKLCDCPKCC